MANRASSGVTPWRMLVVVAAAVVAGGALFAWSSALFPLFAGFLLAYLAHPLASFLERHHLPRLLGFLGVLVLIAAVVTLVLAVFLPALLNELVTIGDRLPTWQEVMQERVDPALTDLKARYPQAYAMLAGRFAAWAHANLPLMADRLVSGVGNALSSVLGFASVLLNLVLIPVIAAYLTVDFNHFIASFRRLVPRPVLPTVDLVVGDVHAVLSSFIRGQLLVSLALAAMYTGGLLLVRAPLALVIGPLAGILSLVPYLGLIVGVTSSVLLSFFSHQDLIHPFGALAVFTVAQAVEAWFLTPRLLGRSVGLHPVWVLASLLAGGELFGVPGIIVAVPVAAALRVVMKHATRAYRASAFYQGETPTVVLYTRKDSAECRAFQEILNPLLQRRGVAARVVEVSSSPRLRRTFGDRVPVFEVNGEILCQGEMDEERLKALLQVVMGGEA
jgi:predicted PurR-regulated permease PerM